MSYVHLDSLNERFLIKNDVNLSGVYTYDSIEVIPPLFIDIDYEDVCGEKMFVCKDTTGHVGVYDKYGKMIIPFLSCQMNTIGNLIELENSKGLTYLNSGLDTVLHQYYPFSYIDKVRRITNKYYWLETRKIRSGNDGNSKLKFVMDNTGNFYLPQELERVLLQEMERKRIDFLEFNKEYQSSE